MKSMPIFQKKTPAKRSDFFARGIRQSGTFLRQFEGLHFLTCIILILIHVLLFDSGRFQRMEYVFLDYFFRQRPVLQVDESIVLINIDDESISAIGTWPWPSRYHAQMIDILTQWGAKAIVLDWAFQKEEDAESAKKLEASLAGSGRVYAALALDKKPEKKFWIRNLPVVLDPGSQKKTWIHEMPQAENKTRGLGHHELEADEDGTLRRVHASLSADGETYPYLGLKVVSDIKPTAGKGHAAVKAPVDYEGCFLVNWTGRDLKRFAQFSYADVIRSYQTPGAGEKQLVNPSAFKDKICVLGLTSLNQSRQVWTPLQQNMPAVGAQAQVINSALTSQWLRPLAWKTQVILMILIGLFASILFSIFRNVPSLVSSLILALLWVVGAYLVFWLKGVWVFVFHPLILILTLFIFSAIYNQMMAMRERKRLFDLATRDGLTGLFVIRHFREVLNQNVESAQETGAQLCVILMDIDNFKKINDTYGHPAGDMILKNTAQIILSCVRSKRPFDKLDYVARYGGEEFIVLLKGTKLKDAALKVADRIRKSVEAAEFLWEGQKIPVTLSLGVASLQEGESIPDPMVHRADEALYKAKREGKNRVCTQTISIS